MPRKPRDPYAPKRPASARDIPGALYCDADYGNPTTPPPDPDPGDQDPGDNDPDPSAEEPGCTHAPPESDTVDDLVSRVRGWVPLAAKPRGPRRNGPPPSIPGEDITRAIADANGNILRASRALGVKRPHYVRNRLRRDPSLWPKGVPRAADTIGRSRVPVAEAWAAWEQHGNVTHAAIQAGLPPLTMRRFLRRNGVGPLPHPWARPKETAPPEEPQGAPTTDAVSGAGPEADTPGTPPGPTGAPSEG